MFKNIPQNSELKTKAGLGFYLIAITVRSLQLKW